MSDFGDYLKKMADDLSVLSNDIKKTIAEKSKGKDGEKKKDFKDVSLRSLQPTIKMYGSKKEADASKESPELDFVTSQIKKIFGG